jgi:hypothetical protein
LSLIKYVGVNWRVAVGNRRLTLLKTIKNPKGKKMEESFKEQLQKNALEATLKTLHEKAASLVCPDHGQGPRIKFSEGAGAGKQNIGFDCCCDRLGKMLEEALKN